MGVAVLRLAALCVHFLKAENVGPQALQLWPQNGEARCQRRCWFLFRPEAFEIEGGDAQTPAFVDHAACDICFIALDRPPAAAEGGGTRPAVARRGRA